MEKIKAIFAAIDESIQRKFDAAVFFLMRHCGLRKAIIRYALWTIYILCFIVTTYCVWVKNGHKLDWAIALDGLWIFFFFCLQRRDYRQDLSASGKSAYSATDLRYAKILVVGKVLLWCMFFIWLELTLSVWMMTAKDNDHFRHLRIMQDLASGIGFMAFLAMLYLVRTPPVPPPREERLKVLVPAKDSSS